MASAYIKCVLAENNFYYVNGNSTAIAALTRPKTLSALIISSFKNKDHFGVILHLRQDFKPLIRYYMPSLKVQLYFYLASSIYKVVSIKNSVLF